MRKLVACAGIAALMCLPLACSGQTEESRPTVVSTRVSATPVDVGPQFRKPIDVGDVSVTVLESVANPGQSSGVEETPARGYKLHMIVVEVKPFRDREVCGATWIITRVYDGVGDPYNELPLSAVSDNPSCGSVLKADRSALISLVYEVPIGRTILEWGVASTLAPKPKTVSLPAA